MTMKIQDSKPDPAYTTRVLSDKSLYRYYSITLPQSVKGDIEKYLHDFVTRSQ